MHVSAMSAAQIYSSYVRYIGVGAIATAGIFGVIKSLRVIAGSFSIALRAFRSRVADTSERTDRDISLPTILLGIVVSALAVAIFFSRLQVSWTILAVGLALTLLFAFFFASVAANAIATTANNPASGMTMLTVIISSVVLLHFGLSGNTGMFFIMAIAGMVCTALCVSGQFMTDLKTGYWLGNTPAAQEKVKFIGILAAAAAAGLTIVLLAHTFQFGEAAAGDMRPVLAAPQASIMKALVVGFMSRQPVTYLLFGVGALITVVLEMLGKSSMVFALGIYLPLSLTTPILTGGFLSHFVNRRAEKAGGEAGPRHSRARHHSGLGTHGRRRARRRARRGPAPLPELPRRPHPDAVLCERPHFAIRFRVAFHRSLPVCLVRSHEKGERCSHEPTRSLCSRRRSRHRHPLGRRRHVSLRHGPLHRRLVVLR